ncbi:hypothetical protein Cgig2_024474 [Carnegiea gigantea]|uniref:Uncharacterized protein n=1 Tax=Carnegiea gigantea TaxID=171969 RepID=A0A9Q1KKX2_9CARY|nr:hypothetical protein Cgig2_024474 [Carnegiea gigantea]
MAYMELLTPWCLKKRSSPLTSTPALVLVGRLAVGGRRPLHPPLEGGAPNDFIVSWAYFSGCSAAGFEDGVSQLRGRFRGLKSELQELVLSLPDEDDSVASLVAFDRVRDILSILKELSSCLPLPSFSSATRTKNAEISAISKEHEKLYWRKAELFIYQKNS